MRLTYGAALVAAGLCASLPAAHAAGLDDGANMKILAARAQMMRLNSDYFNEQIKNAGAPTTKEEALDLYRGRVGCGSVDIGNQVVSSGIGNEISVIILGDVINVGNRCTR
ncbi:MAG TPA: hypothetical protein VFF03_07685 [Rhodocyclaceae bacterium]|nr:hypothetical protein [Rhodocyclaceae bacterium]